MNDDKKEPSDWDEWFINNTTGIIMFTVGAWLILGWVIPLAIGLIPKPYRPDLSTAGQFGDMFGSVNSLFTGAAFFAAMIAVLMQRIELRESGKRQLDQDTLQLRQTELAATTAQIQAELMTHQQQMRLETHFEKLMDVIISIKSKCRLYWQLLEKSDQKLPLSERTVLLPVVDELTRLLATLEKLRLQSAIMFRKKATDLIVVLNSVLNFTHSLLSETQETTREDVDTNLKLWELQLAKAIVDFSPPADSTLMNVESVGMKGAT